MNFLKILSSIANEILLLERGREHNQHTKSVREQGDQSGEGDKRAGTDPTLQTPQEGTMHMRTLHLWVSTIYFLLFNI